MSNCSINQLKNKNQTLTEIKKFVSRAKFNLSNSLKSDKNKKIDLELLILFVGYSAQILYSYFETMFSSFVWALISVYNIWWVQSHFQSNCFYIVSNFYVDIELAL